MDSDSWETPRWLFDELNQEFHFDVDLCATDANKKCLAYYHDYLENHYMIPYYIDSVRGHALKKITLQDIYLGDRNHLGNKDLTCFMNPPYSSPKPFIEKAWEDSKYCKIVCLVKCDPSTRWWATFWNYDSVNRGPKSGCEVRFFPKRIKFDPPKGYIEKTTSASFPCALVIMDRRGL